ncbi:hypothetical protein [Candidatus Spongiihabitans sp.]
MSKLFESGLENFTLELLQKQGYAYLPRKSRKPKDKAFLMLF